MDFLFFQLGIFGIFCLSAVSCSITEQEMAPILQKFEARLFEKWETNYMKHIERKLSEIPGMVTAIQGTKFISGLL